MKRAGRLTVLTLVGAGFLAAGSMYVPDPGEGFVVSRWIWGSGPWLESAGLKWRLPLLTWHSRYSAHPFPLELDLRQDGGDPPVSREGAAVRVVARVWLAPDSGSVLQLHASLGDQYRDLGKLASTFSKGIREAASRSSYDGLLSLSPDVRETLAAALRRGAAADGLLITSLDDIAVWPEIYPQGTGEPADRERILIAGLDGADWEILDPLMASGRMPNLRALVDGGVRARLKTIEPVLSPIIWTSIATGKKPEKHGIMDFLASDSRTGETIPVTSTMRKARAFWGILSGRGITVGTIAWWATWPAEPVLGFQVSDRVAYQVFGESGSGAGLRGRTYPESLMLALARYVPAAREAAAKDAEELLGRPAAAAVADEQALVGILTSTRIYHASALHLLREFHPRVSAVYYEGTDTVAHLFMHYAPPRMPGVTPDQLARWGLVTERYYLLQDRLLGELIQAAGPGTAVIVISDHGFKSGSSRPQTDPRIGVGAAADWHRKFGIFAASGPGFRRGAIIGDLSVLDVTPTLLTLLGLPIASDMDGTVASAALERAVESGGGAPAAIPTYETEGEWAGSGKVSVAEGGVAGEVEREMIAKLTALGYIGQTSANAGNNVGLTLLRQGRGAEAEQAFRAALRKDPAFDQVRVNLARSLMAQGRHAEARVELDAVRAKDPNLPDVDNLTGNIEMDGGDLAGAEATFRRALSRDERNPNLWNSLGIVLDRMGRQEEAISAYRRVIAIDKDYAEAINNIGLVRRTQGRLKEAIEQFEEAKKADSDFPGSYNNLGLIYQDMNDQNAALAAYDQGLRIDPENPVILNNRGSALMALGRTAEAKSMFEKAIAADPNYPSAHNNLGAALGAGGDDEKEFEAYLKAIELDPNYVDARFNLALNLARRHRNAEAAKALNELLKITPGHARALAQQAILEAQAGSLDRALASAAKARLAMPKWTFARNLSARLLMAAGRKEEALREVRLSLTLDPNQPEMRNLLRELETTSGSKP